MSDTGWVATGTHLAVPKIPPRFFALPGLMNKPRINDLARLTAWYTGVQCGVGLFTNAGLNAQSFIKSNTVRWFSLYVLHKHAHPLLLCNSKEACYVCSCVTQTCSHLSTLIRDLEPCTWCILLFVFVLLVYKNVPWASQIQCWKYMSK